MSTEKIIKIINKYFDNELSKQDEIILFTQLSQNEEAREYFKQQNILKTSLQASVTEFPEELEKRILNSIGEINSRQNSPSFIKKYLPVAISSGVALLLLLMSLLFYSKTLNYKEQLNATIWQVNKQQQMIQLLFNSLPTAEVKGYLKNQVIITPKM